MKIALTGAHGTGKSTLLNDLKECPEFANIEFLPEITRKIKTEGFPINEEGTTATQILVMNEHTNNLFTKNNFIVDRCLIDGYVYTYYLADEERCSPFVVRYAHQLLFEFGRMYDIIFYLKPEFKLHDDGVRSQNKFFYEKITQEFAATINEFKDFLPIVELYGSRVERVTQVLEEIRKRDAQ